MPLLPAAAVQQHVPDDGTASPAAARPRPVRSSLTAGSRWTGGLRRLLVLLVLVVVAGAVLGAATSFAQTVLPDALRPFANSASGWTLLTVLVVGACRVRPAPSAVLGAASFAALVLGYWTASVLRGFPDDETLFLVIGVVVGPFVGVATSWLRQEGVRAAVGCGALAGIAVGESAYGLLVVVASTGWTYWAVIGGAGIALLGHTLLRRLHAARPRLLAVGLVLATAAAFFALYSSL